MEKLPPQNHSPILPFLFIHPQTSPYHGPGPGPSGGDPFAQITVASSSPVTASLTPPSQIHQKSSAHVLHCSPFPFDEPNWPRPQPSLKLLEPLSTLRFFEPMLLADESPTFPSNKAVSLSISSKKRRVERGSPRFPLIFFMGKGIQQLGEAAKNTSEIQPKTADQSPASAADKTAAKQGKQESQASDLPKEEYIHVRAHRGQATNSHTLAERVRREKISERMKFLQDLVPGCSKVTGKAVMLDEIINYVQSLQRQVEFLSMKLATVNPRLDFKLEGFLAKDILQPRAVPTPTLAFSADMSIPYPPLHPSHPGLIPAGFPSMETHSDVLRRTVNTQLNPMTGEFIEHSQLLNAWDNDLHNVVQMSYGTNAPQDGPQDGQEANVSTPTEHMKVEL